MQDPKEIDASYQTPDPWGYQTNPADRERKERILFALETIGPFERALDIGAGEGWITKDLPAKEKCAFEISDLAAGRMPPEVSRVFHWQEHSFDLVTATGVLYSHYDWKRFLALLESAATNIVLTCNIKDWERPEITLSPWKEWQFYEEEFPYREYTQKLRVFAGK